jgi:DNA-binding response OmpR family regulator
MPKTILIIEDDLKIAELMQLYLEKEDFRVIYAATGTEGLELALKIQPDLLILDRMLPGLEGLEVLRQLRSKFTTPVLIVSAKSDEVEKIVGLEVGADDYLSKPFSPKELVARVKAILRRAQAQPEDAREKVKLQDLILDPERMTVMQEGKTIPLSALEFKLLYTLVRHPGRVYSREQLMQEVYESASLVFDRTVDAHIKNIRKKLSDNPKNPRYIASVFGVGYKVIDA